MARGDHLAPKRPKKPPGGWPDPVALVLVGSLVGHLTIQLVTGRADGNEIDIHY